MSFPAGTKAIQKVFSESRNRWAEDFPCFEEVEARLGGDVLMVTDSDGERGPALGGKIERRKRFGVEVVELSHLDVSFSRSSELDEQGYWFQRPLFWVESPFMLAFMSLLDAD